MAGGKIFSKYFTTLEINRMLEAVPEPVQPPKCLDNFVIIFMIMKWSFILATRYILIVSLLGLFLHQSYTALRKYQDSKTSYHISLKVYMKYHQY